METFMMRFPRTCLWATFPSTAFSIPAQQIFSADCPNTSLSQIGQSCKTTDPGATINDGSVPRIFANTSPFFYINSEEGSANSTYNALQASFGINNWHGLTSTFNYSWS